MLNVVFVQVANYCGRGREYVEKARDNWARSLSKVPHRFLCLTDDPTTLPDGVKALEAEQGLWGWWNKITLFKPGMLPEGERILFSDLDVIPIRDLTDIGEYRGPFAVMRDPFNKLRHGSALMAWEGGTLSHIYDKWVQGGKPQFDPRGDQFWIESVQPECDYWQDMFPGQIVSFKADCLPLGGIPPAARLICFHGRPRPHEVNFLIPTENMNGCY